ncbi:MAG: pallilysin-related adhesin [Spirochaetales bacterium]|nr:pallilysin-related adhesin [Spirochaetales bacterium]
MTKKRQIISTIATVAIFSTFIITTVIFFQPKKKETTSTQYPVMIDLTKSKIENEEKVETDEIITTDNTKAKVEIPTNMTVLQIHNLNIDFDTEEEQIIIAKSEHTINPVIRIYIVDYDVIRESYRIAWSDNTLATNVTSFKVFINDVTGDRETEIICTGINKDKGQTIDIYKRIKTERTWELTFKNIANISSLGTLNLLETERSVAYTNNQALGKSFDIESIFQESPSSNYITKEIFRWDATLEKYITFETTKIDIEDVNNETLRRIHRGNITTFLDFLSGIWIKEGNTRYDEQIYFNYINEEKTIDFYTGEIIDTYYVKRHEKRIYNEASLDAYNTFIGYIRMLMRIKVINPTRIYINVNDYNHNRYTSNQNQDKTGYYRKLSDSEINKFKNIKEVKKETELSGYFTADDGSEYYFKSNIFTQTKNGETLNGGYAIYEIGGQKIFQLRYIEKNKTTKISTFLIEYEGDSPNSGFTLRPSKITIHGPEATDGTIIKIESEVKSN